jgi:hypothetical protein
MALFVGSDKWFAIQHRCLPGFYCCCGKFGATEGNRLRMNDLSVGGVSLDCAFSTPDGMAPLDWLKPGDLIETKDDGFQAIQKIELVAEPCEAVQIDGMNGAVLTDQRMLAAGWPVEMYFGLDEMLACAGDIYKDLVGGNKARFAHVVMEIPALVRVGTFWMESHGTQAALHPVLSPDDVLLIQRVFGNPMVRCEDVDKSRQSGWPDDSTTIGSRAAVA